MDGTTFNLLSISTSPLNSWFTACMFAISLAKIGSNELIFLCSLYLNTVLSSIKFLFSQEQMDISIANIIGNIFCLNIKLYFFEKHN